MRQSYTTLHDYSGALPRSGAEGGADLGGRLGDGGVAGSEDLDVGQRAVGGAQAQRVGKRATAGTDLRAGVDVKQPQVLEQVAGARPQCVLDLGSRDALADDESDVDRRDGV